LWNCRLFTFGLFALFCYEISEISINSFFINYVTDDGWLDARDASLILSFGGLGLFMCGRFVGSWVMRYVRAERALLTCGLGAVIAVGVVLANVGLASRICLLLVYVCEAIMFPTIFAIALKGLGIYTQRASSYLMMSPIGGAVGPLLMGYVADQSSMTTSFIVPFLGFFVVLLYAIFADRKAMVIEK
jgi:FHS family L-fucose permease-like MFS transporter